MTTLLFGEIFVLVDSYDGAWFADSEDAFLVDVIEASRSDIDQARKYGRSTDLSVAQAIVDVLGRGKIVEFDIPEDPDDLPGTIY